MRSRCAGSMFACTLKMNAEKRVSSGWMVPMLVSRGPDALPHATLVDSCKEVWGVSDDEAAEATLQSFAACATLSATVRAKALAMTSVQERCALVIEALEGKRRRLAALAALQAATSMTGEK